MNLYICNLLLKIHAGMNGLEAESYREGWGGRGGGRRDGLSKELEAAKYKLRQIRY